MVVPAPKKLKSGTWFIQMRLGGISVPVTGATAKECRDKAALIKAEHRAGVKQMKSPDGKTLRQASADYISRRKGRALETTISGYEKILQNYFQSILDYPLSKITWNVLDNALADECCKTSQRGGKLSAKTIHNAFGFYSSVLKENNVTFDRPFTLPEMKHKPIQLPTPDEIFNAVRGTEIELPCLLAMWLTMSISEIRGLTKSKSIHNGQISIVETVVDVNGIPVRKEGGKEELRSRTHDIPPYIQTLIDNVDGDVICPLSSQATNKRLQRRLEKFGIKKISFHKLRHISASTMALLNIPDNYAKEKGGWKTDYVMQKVYTHTFTQGRLAADKKMNDLFSEIITGEKMEKLEVNIKPETLAAIKDVAQSQRMTYGQVIDAIFANKNAN